MPFFRAFQRGIHPDDNKNTSLSPTIALNNFSHVEILLQQHVGPPCVSAVNPGDRVFVGQIIGKPDHPMAVPVHASVSGFVAEIKDIVASTGKHTPAVLIESDEAYTLSPSLSKPYINSCEDFISAVRASGLVGLGGAAFPTHIKLSPPLDKQPDTLIVNAAECEPYITSDDCQMRENPNDILDGILAVKHWLNIPHVIFGIEKNKPQAIASMKAVIATCSIDEAKTIRLASLRTKYPQGAEKMLIYSLTGRKVPTGGLPHDVNTLVMNVTTLRHIGYYLRTGIPLVRKLLTLDGSALNKPGNFDVPIGAIVSDIIEASGGFKEDPKKIIVGGPMMGITLDRLAFGIRKNSNAILVFGKKEAQVPFEAPCIRCGRCVAVCPMLLMPTGIDRTARQLDAKGLVFFRTMDCIECGCCTYVCPAKRYLTQSIPNGKVLISSQKDKATQSEKQKCEGDVRDNVS